MKQTDYHTHILPGMDDGAKDKETALAILEQMKAQGITRVVATPHFYKHREKSVEHFLEKRQAAYEAIKNQIQGIEIVLGAEISVEMGISEVPDIEKLAYQGTDLILLEPSYSGYGEWMQDEVHNLCCAYHLTPIIAHVHRYAEIYTKDQLERVLAIRGIFQVNTEAFLFHKSRKIVRNLWKEGETVIFGSDSHNLSDRKPNFDVLRKKAKEAQILASNEIFEKHCRKE